MTISNTSILIKRSSTTAEPDYLNSGELAYSYVSNTLFIGTDDSSSTLKIGGQLYTSIVDAATSANIASTIVKREVNGAFLGQLYGNANTATQLKNNQNFSISGGDITASSVSFTGNNAVVLNASLNTISGLTAGYYGGSSQGSTTIPVINVAANGRIMSISNTTSTSSLTISDGIISNTIYSGATFYHKGSTGITTSVSSNTVTIGTDNTVVRSNTASVGTQVINTGLTVSNDVIVQGNLTILGSSTTINTTSIELNDSLIYLANNNYLTDAVDIGIIGHYNAGTNAHAGIIRDPNLKEWLFFQGYTPEVGSNNIIDINHESFAYANVYASTFKGNIIASNIYSSSLSLNSALPISSGGTNNTTYTTGSLLAYDGTKFTSLANSSFSQTGTGAANNTITSLSVDAYGRVTAASYSAISGLTVAQGGTGLSTANTNGIIFGNGTGSFGVTVAAGVNDQSYSNQILTVTNSGQPTWSSSLDGGAF